ncbi:hypothetical protein [Polyangium jinanense]|uniref:Uncharacterized protein n=1 Tax=Polyangium jinanense TaxID=2829994 RepID=A0A9X3X7T2_9BACT|nr:hypothetical protein [Polyangium jinanense]MDC3985797.1 hypothetical protein [Polyangium jinanense]
MNKPRTQKARIVAHDRRNTSTSRRSVSSTPKKSERLHRRALVMMEDAPPLARNNRCKSSKGATPGLLASILCPWGAYLGIVAAILRFGKAMGTHDPRMGIEAIAVLAVVAIVTVLAVVAIVVVLARWQR